MATPTRDSLQLFQETNQEFEYELDCDACGCAVGSATYGMENLLSSNFIGVRYLHQYYKAKEDVFSNQLNQKQHFNTVQVWAKIPVSNQIDLIASLPYHSHQKSGDNSVSINGIGDANVMGTYKIIQPSENATDNVKHFFNAAIGIKIPLAKFNNVYADTPNPSFQLGTGSWDTQFGLNYQITIKDISVQMVTDYNLKGENKNKYKFGDQWNQLIQIQYPILKNNTQLIGKLGFQNEFYQANKQFNEFIPKTKGNLQLAKIGLEGSTSKFNYGIEYLLPIRSDLNSGEVKFKNRLGLFINYKIF
ncbi:hypothetical protein [Faecalibacter sp. LW9]|uniref:hypothetical protein n=1 Tax=Faecalibacter sp. LW9 TaxID=3103144 RepID=UPI002B0005B7|nr:hypothetical protein [Faecalibacter sp. LW9]